MKSIVRFKKAQVAALAALVIILNFFFFHPIYPVGLALIFGLFTIFLKQLFLGKMTLREYVVSVAPVVVLIALALVSLVIRTFVLVNIISVLFCLASFLYILFLLGTEYPFFRSLSDAIFSPFAVLKAYFNAIFFAPQEKKIASKTAQGMPLLGGIRSIVVGLIIALPIAVILLGMLSSADPIYGNFIKHLFHSHLFDHLPTRIITSAAIFLLLFPLVNFNRKTQFTSPVSFLARLSFANEYMVVMALVALILGSFIIIQWPYIFAHVAFETDLSKLGVATYSEYVRKGFGEFMVITLFIYSLIWGGLVALRGKKTDASHLSVIQLIVLGEFSIFLFSLFRRIWLYQLYHGWSLIRIYGGLFLIFILGLTVTLALRHIIKKQWIKAEIGWGVLLFLFIIFFNAESYIVSTHPPTVNKRVDYVYLSRMSPEGYAGWQKALEHAQSVLDMSQYNQTINKDQRREIAYSAHIIQNLMINYDDLIMKYGSPDEVRQYYTEIATQDKNQLLAWNSSPAKMTYEGQNVQEEINKTSALLQSLSNSKTDPDKITPKAQLFIYNPLNNYNSFNPDELHKNPLSFYRFTYNGVTENVLSKSLQSSTDKFFTWNKTESSVYQKMKGSGMLLQLQELEKHYFQLYEIISKQPAEERNYEQDISMNSPLL